MNQLVKSYYLFKWRIWSVVVEGSAEETDELEEETDGSAPLDASITLAADDRPAFGFTPWTPEPWGDYED